MRLCVNYAAVDHRRVHIVCWNVPEMEASFFL